MQRQESRTALDTVITEGTSKALMGIAVWNYREGSLASRIERFAGMGYNAVSLSANDARALCLGNSRDVEDAILKHSLALTVHAGFSDHEGRINSDLLMKDFENILKWNARTGVLRTINYDAAKTRDENGQSVYKTQEMHDILSDMLDLSCGAGFRVGVEDWPRNQEQLQSVNDLQKYNHFGILIDLGHLNIRIRQGRDPEASFPTSIAQAYIDAIPVPVNELHIHNNNGIKDLHAPPKTGNADIPAIAKMLEHKGVSCVSTIEIAPSFCGISEDEAIMAASESIGYWMFN